MTRRRWLLVGVVAWGCLLSAWSSRVYFIHPPDRVHANHERHSYAARVVEFRDLLDAGYWSPEWATHFRGGLGSPYFSYYQPGFFHVVSLVPWSVPPNRAIGLAVAAFSLTGYLALFVLVRRRFGTLSGVLGASMLLLSVYTATEIAVRGDLTEHAAMMLFAVVLASLDGWMSRGHAGWLVALALGAAAVTVTHPGVALMGNGLVGLLVVALLIAPVTRRRALGALAALAVAVGLSAFYWVPVLFALDLVSPAAAFEGFYDYSRHFVPPRLLLGPYSRETVIPATLGPIVPALVLLNTLLVFVVRRRTREHETAFAIGLACLALSLFMMTRASAFAWEAIEPLQRLQFPWRFFALTSVFSAALAGAMPRWRHERVRGVVVALVLLAALGASREYTAHSLHSTVRVPESAEALLSEYLAPDLADEWMPAGADIAAREVVQSLPEAGPGATVSGFELEQGRLRAHVRAASESWVRLPHHHFPVGWEATLDGRPVALEADDLGLMRVRLPAGAVGTLEVVFVRTPARRLGLRVSAASLLLGLVALFAFRRRIASAGSAASRPARPSDEGTAGPRGGVSPRVE